MKGFPAGLAVKTPPAVQGTQVQPLVQEGPTCPRAAEPVCHTAEALAFEGLSSATREAPQEEAQTARGRAAPLATTGEGPRAAPRVQDSHNKQLY